MIPRLHIVTDDEILSRRDFLPRAQEILESGGRKVAFHLRGPRTPGRVLYSAGRVLSAVAESSGSTLLVNDRVDLALALPIDGAHLGQRSMPPAAARTLLGPERALGLSVHGTREAREAEEEGEGSLDFLMVGSIFPTPSHPDRVPAGLEILHAVRGLSRLPLIAIGGMKPGRIAGALGAGAHGIAVRGGIWDATDPSVAVEGYVRETEEGKGP